VESAELIEILRTVRDRVRSQYPEPASEGLAGEPGAPPRLPIADLLPIVHARDAAMGKVAAIGSVNPRPGGPVNAIVQAWKRFVARVLDWHVREQVEFNRKVVAAIDAAIEAMNQTNRALLEESNQRRDSLLEATNQSSRAILALDNHLAIRVEEQHRRIDEQNQRLDGIERKYVETFQGELQELKDIRKHWADWRIGWEHKLATNEIQFLRSVADLQGAFQHRASLMDSNYRDSLRGQHAEFTAALERSAIDIQKQMWADFEKIRLEYERIIHNELRVVRQQSAAIGQTVPGSAAGPAAASAPAGQAWRPTPLAFVERFRGSEEHVKNGQEFYLPFFKDCRNVLDIGCGRGEFLRTLHEAGVPAIGIDLSEESVTMCRNKGLDAEVADLFDYLANLPEGALDGIFCAQVVEHLPPERLPEMIKLCASRLARNGVIALETPNPECLAIFATHFYLDPTHTRPVPHPLLAFYLEESGVGNIEVTRLAPALDSMPALASLPEEFREAFFGYLDYAIRGKKL
jgi:2-polyprenyl-3-methyl-5-hydroxy-6-metoxy-1,4-benzoquinol methylase